jgi:hypothetical protein
MKINYLSCAVMLFRTKRADIKLGDMIWFNDSLEPAYIIVYKISTDKIEGKSVTGRYGWFTQFDTLENELLVAGPISDRMKCYLELIVGH